MNIYQKIVFNKCGKYLKAGETAILDIDWLMVHDGSILMVERYYQEYQFEHVFDPNKIIVVFDHIYPANNALTANLHNKARIFIKKHKIQRFFEGGQGISHQLLLENKEIKVGDFLLGGDSHTPTIGANSVMGLGVGATDATYAMLSGKTWFTMGNTIKIKLTGQTSSNITAKDIVFYIAKNIESHRLQDKYIVYETQYPLPLDWRAVLCNMSPELNAVTSLFEIDAYNYKISPERYSMNLQLNSDSDNDFDDIETIDVSYIEPLVAKPHEVTNIVSLKEKIGVKVDVVFIGTCTGGRIEDLLAAAAVFKKAQTQLKTRLLINPASIKVYQEAINLGLIGEFLELGATILPPSCGPCLGQNMGALADNEVCVSTANRNYKGRMGNKNAFIYLCSPVSAAYAAIEGVI